MKSNRIQRTLKSSLTGAFVLTSILGALVASGCGDPDPGVCYTAGEYPKNQVSRSYAETMCTDWVRLLLSNCVSVSGLPLNPTAFEIGNYCGREVTERREQAGNGYPGYGSSDEYSYQIRHTCNFVDNPSYECRQYAAGGVQSKSLTQSALDSSLTSALEGQIQASPSLSASAKLNRLYVEGTTLNLGTHEIK